MVAISMITSEDIRKLGLSEKEAKVYFALLKAGGALPAMVAKEAGVNRATTYEVLTRLHERGLVMKIIKKNKYYFTCAEPDAFSEFFERRSAQIQKHRAELERLLPQLNYFYSHSPHKPKIHFFDSMNGIRESLFHSLEGGHDEILSFTSLSLLERAFDKRVLSSYFSKLVKHGTRVRYVDYGTHDKQARQKFLSTYFTHTARSLLPQIESVEVLKAISNIVTIYGNFVSLIDARQPEVMAVILENEDIAETFRMMFEAAWSKQKNSK